MKQASAARILRGRERVRRRRPDGNGHCPCFFFNRLKMSKPEEKWITYLLQNDPEVEALKAWKLRHLFLGSFKLKNWVRTKKKVVILNNLRS